MGGVLSCPYRGEAIPGLAVKNTPATVCNHPAVRGPCVLSRSDGTMPSCFTCPKYWRDSKEVAAAKMAGLAVLDPSLWAQPEKPKPKANPLPILDCQHRGEYTGKTAECPTGCATKFKIFQCDIHTECTISYPGKDVAAVCATCPDRLPGPQKGIAVKPAPRLLIERAPRLSLSPVLKRAVVTIAAGREGKALHAISGPLMTAYAERIGADFVVLDWPGVPQWPMSAKYGIPRTLDDHLWERIVYLDADVIVPPDAVNLFELCGPEEFGAFDELPFVRLFPKYRQENNYQQFRKLMGLPPVDPPFYFNAGVLVVSRQNRELLEPPAKPMPIGHCREQDSLNANVYEAWSAGLVKVRKLDRRANWQNWLPGFADAPPDALLHFSGGGPERKKRLESMRAWAEKLTPAPSPA